MLAPFSFVSSCYGVGGIPCCAMCNGVGRGESLSCRVGRLGGEERRPRRRNVVMPPVSDEVVE